MRVNIWWWCDANWQLFPVKGNELLGFPQWFHDIDNGDDHDNNHEDDNDNNDQYILQSK